MKRVDLEHVVAAAAQISDEVEFVVIGSQAILAVGYAHGLGPETAKAPAGWEDRLVLLNVQSRPADNCGAVAMCLEAHDLVLAKCARGEDRDWESRKTPWPLSWLPWTYC